MKKFRTLEEKGELEKTRQKPARIRWQARDKPKAVRALPRTQSLSQALNRSRAKRDVDSSFASPSLYPSSFYGLKADPTRTRYQAQAAQANPHGGTKLDIQWSASGRRTKTRRQPQTKPQQRKRTETCSYFLSKRIQLFCYLQKMLGVRQKASGGIG